MAILETLNIEAWEPRIAPESQEKAIQSLEQGKVLYFPSLHFPIHPHEEQFLSPMIVQQKSKNISYDIRNDRLGGTQCDEPHHLKELVKRYALYSRSLFHGLFPRYVPHVKQARTSFRPVETSDRAISPRKDDRLLHVDSFPANPVKGERILRFFTNVNPHGKPRVWRVGEPFPSVVEKMAPRAKHPWPFSSQLLKLLRITKDYRTLYDHYMLQIHDAMKLDPHYQKEVQQWEVHFPPGSTWVVYTDQVSHAAMSGQHLFEQTFHLPLAAMHDPNSTPQRILESYYKKALV